MTTAKAEGPEVYRAIAAVQGELAKTGISKDGVNSSQNYKFRGIDQVYGALSPLLAKYGLCVLPRIIEREMMERVTIKEWNGQKKESVLFYVTVTAEFDFVATADGSTHTVRTYGEAMDSGDKATNKAMSAAYKYAAFMAFAIPTEGDNDADAQTHEVQPQEKPKPRENWGGRYPNKTSLHRALTQHTRDLEGCGDLDMLEALVASEEYKDFVSIAEDRAKHYLYGGDPAPAEFQGLFAIEQRLRDQFQMEGQ